MSTSVTAPCTYATCNIHQCNVQHPPMQLANRYRATCQFALLARSRSTAPYCRCTLTRSFPGRRRPLRSAIRPLPLPLPEFSAYIPRANSPARQWGMDSSHCCGQRSRRGSGSRAVTWRCHEAAPSGGEWRQHLCRTRFIIQSWCSRRVRKGACCRLRVARGPQVLYNGRDRRAAL